MMCQPSSISFDKAVDALTRHYASVIFRSILGSKTVIDEQQTDSISLDQAASDLTKRYASIVLRFYLGQ
jgi:hypothetical protein